MSLFGWGMLSLLGWQSKVAIEQAAERNAKYKEAEAYAKHVGKLENGKNQAVK